MQLTDLAIKKLKQKNLNRYLSGLLECLGAFGQTKLTKQHATLVLQQKNRLGHITVLGIYMDKVIGTATLILEPKYLRNGSIIGHIEDVAVLEEYRTFGIGQKLIEKLCGIAKKNNCYKVILDCADHNVHFYERCGFHKHENCMRKDL